MSFNVDKRTIYSVLHGSHAYGLATPTSDIDIKGVCIEPKEYHYGFLNRFEQEERLAVKGNSADVVIYSLKKFVRLALQCNPNIIEVLWVDESSIKTIDQFGERLRSIKQDFLSKRALESFGNYARSQLHHIQTHRSWLLNPPKAQPTREEFGLQPIKIVSKSELGAYEGLVQKNAEFNMSESVIELYAKEKRFRSAQKTWAQYNNWKITRNPIRFALEAKFGYDTKHASHLIRLLRMCKEILLEHKVHVLRHDRDELLAIKRGEWSYEKLINEADKLAQECNSAATVSTLPSELEGKKFDEFVVSMTEEYLSVYG